MNDKGCAEGKGDFGDARGIFIGNSRSGRSGIIEVARELVLENGNRKNRL